MSLARKIVKDFEREAEKTYMIDYHRYWFTDTFINILIKTLKKNDINFDKNEPNMERVSDI